MVKIGIAGIGQIATSYIKLISDHNIHDVELVALSSRNLEAMNRVVETFNLSNVLLFQDYETMIKEGGIDAVIICTPHRLHPSMAYFAMQHDKHVLVEKPIGVHALEIEKLIELQQLKPHLKGGVLYNRRSSKCFKFAKEMIEQDAIGKLKRVNWIITNLYRTNAYYKSSSWRGTFDGEGGGILMNQAAHQLDLLQWLCGMPLSLYAFCYNGVGRNIEVENDVTIMMQFENQATGQFIASSREFPGSNRLEISGDKGQIIIQNDEMFIYRELEMNESEFNEINDSIFGKIPYKTEVHHFDEDSNEIQQSAMINQFIQAIIKNDRVACSFEEAYRSLQLTQGSYLSSWTQSRVSMPFRPELFQQELEAKIGKKTKEQ